MTAKKTKKRSGPNRGGSRLFSPTPKIDDQAMKIVMRMTKEDCAQAFGSEVFGSDQRSPAFRSFVVHAHLLLIRLDQYLAETNQTGTSGPVRRHILGSTLDGFRVDLAHQLAAQSGPE